MALTDEQLEIISDTLTPLFQHLEKEVIADVARRIKKTLTYSRTAELQAMSMRELGYSPAKIRKEAMKLLNSDKEFRKAVAKNTLEYKREIRKLINDITKEAYKANNDIVAGAGNMSWIDDLSVWKKAGKNLGDNSFPQQLVDSFSAQTEGVLKNMMQTTGFKTMSGFEAVETLYKRELDKAAIKICSGTFSVDKVVNDVVHDLAQSGLRTIDFSSGYSMQLDTAARLALRTGCHQLAAKVMDKNMEQSNENLVYVSKHWGARNTGVGHANHEHWQGKVYFIKKGTDYSEEAKRIGQDRITDLWESTGYSIDGAHENDPLGLNGYNCRHHHYVWFEGVSSLPKDTPEPKPVTINGKTYDYYAATQKMRSMERDIRALKREKEALGKLGVDTAEVQAKIRKKTSEYHQFCKDVGINAKDNRLRYEAGTADIKKTEAWKDFNDKKVEFFELGKELGVNADMFRKRSSANDKVVLEYNKNRKAIQSTLQRVEKAKRNLDHEVGTIIDLKGKILAEFDGGDSNVYVDSSMLKDAIFTHNHPNGGLFSVDDIKNMLETGLYELRVSTPQGIYYSLMRKSGVSISKDFLMAYKEATSSRNARETIRNDIRNGILDKNIAIIHKEEIVLKYRSFNGEAWLRKNADKFGLKYEKGKDDEWEDDLFR